MSSTAIVKPLDAGKVTSVLAEIADERRAQHERWGEQNHHDFDPILSSRVGGCSEQRMANHYEIPTADRARFACDQAHRIGHGSWADILIEEVAEAVGTCNETDDRLRAELVQVAAVAVAWIEAIDRRSENGSSDAAG